MANKKPLWKKKNVSHDEFEKEARQLKREINAHIRNIKNNGKENYGFEEIKKID